jgi:autotransporter-associated beta strand protein
LIDQFRPILTVLELDWLAGFHFLPCGDDDIPDSFRFKNLTDLNSSVIFGQSPMHRGPQSQIAGDERFRHLGNAVEEVRWGTTDELADLAVAPMGSIDRRAQGVISGAGSLIKDGTGILTVTAANTYTGGTSVQNGALTYATTTSKPASGTTTVAVGATLGLGVGGVGYFGQSDVDSLFAGTMTNVSNSPLSNVGLDTAAGNFDYSSSVPANTRGLHKLGANTLTLWGNNTYTGTTYVTAGTLKLAPSSGSALPAAAAVQNNGTFEIAATGQTAGAISGTGTTQVNDNMSLTANSIVQDTLTIGAGGSVTIRAVPVAAGGAGASPVPEPGMWVLIGTALIGWLAFRRRKRR